MKPLMVILALALFGALRLPLERGLAAERVRAGLRDDAGVPLNLREQVNQASLVALLGGLRSLAAAIWDLWACSAWEQTNYAQVERDYLFCQRLQPRTFYYYDRGQWMMAYNAAHYYHLENTDRGASNDLLRSAYTDKGLAMLQAGKRYLPNEPRIFEQEATLYRDKIRPRNGLKEAEAWRLAAGCPGAPAYARRFQAYALAHVPGKEAEAESMMRALDREWRSKRRVPPPPTLRSFILVYDLCRELKTNPLSDRRKIYQTLRLIYERSEPNRVPLVYNTLRHLESDLKIPLPQRLPVPPPETPVGTL